MKELAGFTRWIAEARTRWVVVLLWVVGAGLLSALLPSVGAEVKNNEPSLSESKPSMQAGALAAREFENAGDIPGLVVWRRPSGLTDEDLQSIRELARLLTTDPVPYQKFVQPLHETPLQTLRTRLSEDGSTLVLQLSFGKEADAGQLSEGIAKLMEKAAGLLGFDPFRNAADSSGDLIARVTGPAGIQSDAAGLFGQADRPLLISTVLLVLILLLLIYRSPILALIPLAAVGSAYLVISPILGWMAHEGWITVESQGRNIMSVLLFGAGTDYCLFLISRFRQLLTIEADTRKALRAAVSGSSGAIAMSGLTVILALITLLAAEYGSFYRFAIPFGVAILIMVLSSLTLVPALLAILGRSSFWPLIPRTPEMEAERAKLRGRPVPAPAKPGRYRTGEFVLRRPWLITVAAVTVLGGLALMATRIEYTYDRLEAFPKDSPSREGFAIIGEQFSAGQLAPVKVMVDREGQEPPIGEALASHPFVHQVSEQQAGRINPDIVAFDVQLAMNPYSTEAVKLIPEIRRTVESALEQSGIPNAADRVWISGQTAEQFDTQTTNERDMRVIFPVVIGLIALLLLVYLRSVIAAAYLILTVILSYVAALGAGWLVIHDLIGSSAIQGAVPLYAFIFIVALGEDYNIFMVSGIWRKSRRMTLKQAVLEGVGETGAVIASAGLILAGTFAVLINMPIQLLMQVGIITAIGVLLDTFVVRQFLVPAVTLLLGKWSFWPGRLRSIPAPESLELNRGG